MYGCIVAIRRDLNWDSFDGRGSIRMHPIIGEGGLTFHPVQPQAALPFFIHSLSIPSRRPAIAFVAAVTTETIGTDLADSAANSLELRTGGFHNPVIPKLGGYSGRLGSGGCTAPNTEVPGLRSAAARAAVPIPSCRGPRRAKSMGSGRKTVSVFNRRYNNDTDGRTCVHAARDNATATPTDDGTIWTNASANKTSVDATATVPLRPGTPFMHTLMRLGLR
jgi:hypothetical protein